MSKMVPSKAATVKSHHSPFRFQIAEKAARLRKSRQKQKPLATQRTGFDDGRPPDARGRCHIAAGACTIYALSPPRRHIDIPPS